MEQVCCVCEQVLDEDNVSICNFCGGRFHMAWSTKVDVKNCGRYWVDGNSCAMVFACEKCAVKAGPRPAEEPGEQIFYYTGDNPQE